MIIAFSKRLPRLFALIEHAASALLPKDYYEHRLGRLYKRHDSDHARLERKIATTEFLFNRQADKRFKGRIAEMKKAYQ